MEELFGSLKISNLNGDVNLEEIIDQPGGKSAHLHQIVSSKRISEYYRPFHQIFKYLKPEVRLSHNLQFAVVLFGTFYSFITPKTGAI